MKSVVIAIAFVLCSSSNSWATEEESLVAEVRIDGAPPSSAQQLLSALATRPGTEISERSIAADIERLWRTGLFDDIVVETSHSGRRVTFHVSSHPLSAPILDAEVGVRVELIQIRGNSKTRDQVIRREIELTPGDALTRDSVVRGARKIRALGFFELVDVQVTRGSTPRLGVVTYSVKERETGAFAVGGSYGEISGVGLVAEVNQTNLFGTGRGLGLKARLAQHNEEFQLRYSHPRLADSLWAASASLYTRKNKVGSIQREAVGVRASLARPVGEHTSVKLTYRLESLRSDLADDALLTSAGKFSESLASSGLTSSLRADLAHDSRTKCSRATEICQRGVSAGVYGEVASRVIGSQNEFVRSGAWVNVPVAITANTGVALRGSLEWIGSLFDGEAGVPLGERLYAGGARGVRGHAHGQLSPRLQAGGSSLAIGGTLRLLASAELHFPIWQAAGVSGVAFADAGNVFDVDRRTCRRTGGCPSAAEILAGLRASVGVGLRWRSPIGPLRFDWGVPLFRRPDAPKVRFHFGLADHR